MSVLHPALISEPHPIEAEQFFEQILKKVVEAFSQQEIQIRGTILFELSGEGGGRWMIDLSACKIDRIPEGQRVAAGAKIAATASDFTSLFQRGRDPRAAVDAGKIAVLGNRRLLSWFARLPRA